MLRRPLLLILPLVLCLVWAARAALTTVTVAGSSPTGVYLTSGTTWTVPANWNPANNTIEAIGGGVNGADDNSTGGGGYSEISNLALTSGSTVTNAVGAGGSGAGAPSGNGGATYFNGTSCSTASVCAAGGQNSASGSGKGGQASAGVGTVKYLGGNGAPGIVVITYTPNSGSGDPAPIATLTAFSTSITSGSSSTLTWSSTNATSCTGTGFTPSGTSGSVSVSPTQTTTYSVTCSGANSTSSPASATVTVVSTIQAAAFTALHIYYMSPTGSDSNGGTSASSPWASPNHSGLVCGDVIIAAPGTYTAFSANGLTVTSQPSDCPSTSGGIDGAGGIYFVTVICGGNVGSCVIDTSANEGRAVVYIQADNWAFEGWAFTSTTLGNGGSDGFMVSPCNNHAIYHHIAAINDISYHNNQAFADVGCAPESGYGIDYFAVVGDIAQNANDDPICLAAIDDVAPRNSDTNPGTHVIFDGNFAMANINPTCGSSDGESYMFDTWDDNGYKGTGVIENNIGYDSADMNLQIFQQKNESSSPTIPVFNNTFYHSGACAPWNTYAAGGMNIELDGGFPWNVQVYNNIDYEDLATSKPGSACGSSAGSGGGIIYALLSGSTYSGAPGSMIVNLGGTGIQNVFKSSAITCVDNCDSGNNIRAGNGFGLGTNTYENPTFANTTDLLDNQVGVPSCSSYTNTTACMGWDYATQAAASDSTIGDLDASASGTSGKGYQPPGACGDETTLTGASISGTTLTFSSYSGEPLQIGAQLSGTGMTAQTIVTAGSGTSWTVNNSQTVSSETMGATLYPYWLKGIVYLQWDGTNLWEYSGLVNKPCGL